MDKKDSEPMALVFIEELNRENIPYQHYAELYHRSIGLRANRLANGQKCEDFSVDLMLACWPALQRDLRQREIDAGRTLTSNAASVCQFCKGSNFRDHFVGGEKVGVKKCNHEEVTI